MAKQIEDKATAELFETRKGRGRPSTGCAMSPAERQAAYRAKKQREEMDRLSELDTAESIGKSMSMESLISLMNAEGNSDSSRKIAWLAMGKKMGWI